MWSYIPIDDIPGIERLRDLLHLSGNTCDLPTMRTMAKVSQARGYIYDDPAFTLAVAFAYADRRKWYYVAGLTVVGPVAAVISAPLLVQQAREYLQLVGSDTLYVIASKQPPPVQSQIFAQIALIPGITITKTPQPPQEIMKIVIT